MTDGAAAGSPDGVLLLDKPQGITSHDAVARVRRALGTKKVGHSGTLDPMATGLLVLGVGPSTRLLTHLVGLDKTYEATIRVGRSTTTDDAEGEPVRDADASGIPRAAIEAGIRELTGVIEQRPSAVSAIKVDGVRAYDRVRAGEDVELAARTVTVSAFEVLDVRVEGAFVDLDVRVECSSGTYIRALARDLGAALGVGGHLTALRRTRVGPFDVAEAEPVPAWRERGLDTPPAAALDPRGAPPAAALDQRGAPTAAAEPGDRPTLHAPAEIAARLFPVLELDAAQAADLAHGKRLAVDAPDAATAAAVAPGGRLVGLVAIAGGATRVLTNFPAGSTRES